MSLLSSDSSDDDDLKQLSSAIDPGFLKEFAYNVNKDDQKTRNKSERNIEDGNNNENIIHISQHMQDHFWFKLRQIIDQQVEFIDVPSHKIKTRKHTITGGIKLLSHNDEYLCLHDNYVHEKILTKVIPEQTKEDLDRVEECAVTVDWIMSEKNKKEFLKVSNYPRKPKIEFYKSKKSILNFIEPKNEFSELRRKNNWSECKISRKYKPKTKNILSLEKIE